MVRVLGGAAAAGAALFVHLQMERVLPGGARFALLFPTILMSCLVLGRVGGASALATGLFGIWTLMMPSRGDPTVMRAAEISGLTVYTASGVLVIVVTEAYRAISRQLLVERDAAVRRKAEEDARFVEIFRHSPGLMAIYRGRDLIVEFASQGLIDYLGRGEIQGRPYREVAPETAGELFAIMDGVLEGGDTVVGKAAFSPLRRRGHGALEDRYFDYMFRRIEPSPQGEPRLFVQAVDVTEAVLSRKESQQAERQLKSVLEEMPVGVTLLSVESRQLVLYNRAATEIVGHEILGRTPEEFGLYGAVHLNGAPYAPEDYPAARALAGETLEKEDVLYRRPDGALIHLSVDAKRVADGTGRPMVICAFTDVTPLRQALEAKSLLINELNHRVKNTLATVQALAAQTFSKDPATATERHAFEGRLQALSRAHNVLTEADWRAASLMRVIEGAIAAFGPERFEVRGQDVELSPQKTLAVAMALHELATNAVKYGALSNETGKVVIECDGPDAARTLSWRERGGPTVEQPRRSGFGTRLLRRALAHELDGGIHLAFEPTGVVCKIDGL